MIEPDLKITWGHCQKEDAKNAHTEKRAKNDTIEISGFISMLTTWEYASGHKWLVQHHKFKKIGPNNWLALLWITSCPSD